MKLGLVQTDIVWEDKTANRKKAVSWIRKAKEEQVNLLLFPEMALTGFTMNTRDCAETMEYSATRAWVSKQAKQYGIGIGMGYIGREKTGECYNRYLITDRDGQILCDYAKIHPFSYGKETQYYQKGSRLEQASFLEFSIVPLICYDLRFPELFQLAAKKAQMIIVAASWPAARREHWRCLLRARAIETQCYIAGINRVGSGDGLEYAGDSAIIAPDGKMLAETYQKEGLLLADISLEKCLSYRKKFPVLKDRQETLYERIRSEG